MLRARALFLDDANTYGCAEVTLISLQEHFALSPAADSSPAMALNGGVGYSGGVCGAITGAALVAGRLAGGFLPDHAAAKREARRLVQELMQGFTEEFGSVDCRTLTGYDLLAPGQHQAFIDSGVWRQGCMRQIEFAVGRLARLVEGAARAPGVPSPPGSGNAGD